MTIRNRFNITMTTSLIIACSYFCSHGQGGVAHYLSFTLDSREVVWIKEFEAPHFSASEISTQLCKQLGQNKSIQSIINCENGMEASINNATIDLKKFNALFLNVSYRISHGKWSGQVKVDVEDERYRVTVYKLSYHAKVSGQNWGRVFRAPIDEQSTLSNCSLEKNSAKFVKSGLKDLDVIQVALLDYFILPPDLEHQNPAIATAFD